MKFIVFCCCVGVVLANTYRAGVVLSPSDDLGEYVSLIHKAGDSNVDLLLLTLNDNGYVGNYDEVVKLLSKSAQEAGLYLITSLSEQVTCQNTIENVRNNLVFDRNGDIIIAYRKSFRTVSNCTGGNPDISTFTTDFGVKFHLFMEEDLVLRNLEKIDVQNCVVVGSWSSQMPYLSAALFLRPWAYIHKGNIITSSGINFKPNTESADWTFADLDINGVSESSLPIITPVNQQTYPVEDLSHYIIKPLNLKASSQGYEEVVCHNQLCCKFYVKTSSEENQPDVGYGLAAFDGIRHYGYSQHIGAQNCAIFACAGLYKRSCTIGSKNSTSVLFEKITIRGNFTRTNSAQYPVLLNTDKVCGEQFQFEKSSREVSAEIVESTLLSFGIMGRDYSGDHEGSVLAEHEHGMRSDMYEYFFNENTQEFFDYIWIRVRILLVVVSIYVLEMM